MENKNKQPDKSHLRIDRHKKEKICEWPGKNSKNVNWKKELTKLNIEGNNMKLNFSFRFLVTYTQTFQYGHFQLNPSPKTSFKNINYK